VKKEKRYKGQKLLSFYHCKQGTLLACYVKTNYFRHANIGKRNKKGDINIKVLQDGQGR
jgi:hypothetical protein